MMKLYKIIFSLCLLLAIYIQGKAQNYNMSSTPVTTCSGNFYDDGGPGGNHGDGGTITKTFTSSDGNRLKFVFSSFNTAGNSDRLYIYDGPDNTYPLIRSVAGSAGGFTVESTGSQITFHFTMFANGLRSSGWAATISCTTPALTPYDMTSGTVTACEGVFYDNGGATANYPANEDRTMTFCSGTTDFLQFDFIGAGISGNDSLYIYDGNSTASTPIAIFTSGSRYETFTSTGTCVTFRFKSDASGQSSGWQAIFNCTSTPQPPTNYNISNSVIYTCGGKFYDDGGTGNHGDGGSYTQTFYSSNGNRIKFDFTAFNTAGGSDILRIYDGPNTSYPLLGSYANSSSPGTVESTGSVLTFTWTMFANSLTDPGWEADISCTTPVLPSYIMTSGTVTACSGVFYDNGGPTANYPANEDRTMTFCSGTTDFLQFDFTQATISGNDSLYIYDGNSTASTPIAIFTSGSRFETFTSTGTCVTFQFKSDGSGQSTGWQAQFACTNTPQAPTNYRMSNSVIYTCSGKFYDDGGTANHGDGGSYTQTFYSSNGNRIKFDFTAFNTAGGSDILRIYDGPNTSYPLIGSYANSSSPGTIESSGSVLTFTWNMFSNGLTDPGWEADISCTTAPLTNYPMTSGTVTTTSGVFYDNGGPNANYPDNEDRVQTFCSGNGEYILFDFTHFNISTDDSLFVYDGNSITSPIMGIYTSDNLPEKIYSKSGTCVTFQFKSNGSGNSSGWRGMISTSSTPPVQVFNMQDGVRYTCGGTFHDNGGPSGNYSDNFNRTMTFYSDAGTGCGIRFVFSAFNTQSGSDILYVYDGPTTASPLLGSFSGTALPGGAAGIQSTGNSITFRFQSNGGTNAAGWTADMSCPDQPAVPTITTNSPLCSGGILELNTNTVTDGVYSWTGPDGFSSSDEDPTITNVTTDASGTYSLVVTKNGCTSQGSTVVVVNPVTPVPTAGSNSPICENSTLNLTATTVTNATYSWTGPDGFTSTDQNPSIASVTTVKAGIYSVTAIVDGCESEASTVSVTVNSVGTVTAGNDGPTYCAGSTVNLSANTIASASYSWSGPNGFTSTDQNPSIASATTDASGTYTLTVTVGGCSKESTTDITVNPTPTVPTAGSNSPICAGTTLNLTAATVAGASYSWTGPDGFTSTDQNPSITSATVDASGTYTVTASIGSCPEQSTVNVTVNPTPSVPTAGNNGPICEGEDLNLTAATIAGASYSWSGPDGFSSTDQNPSILSATTNASGTYTVTATIGTCSEQSTTNVTVSAVPVATAGSNGPACEGTTLNLTANTVSGASYSWSGPNGFSSTDEDPSIPSVTTAASGTYTVTITVGSCSDQNDVMVTVNPAPGIPTAGNNGPVCAGSTLNLTAATIAGASYSWSGPDGFSSTDQNPSILAATTDASGTYTVTATIGTCSEQSTTNATVSAPPVASAGSNGPVCEGTSLNLTTNTVAGASYSWSGPNGFSSSSEDPSISSVTTAASGTYTVTITVGSCSDQDDVTVTVNPAPAAPVAGSNSPVCAGDDINLTASTIAGATYSWNGPSGFSSTDQNPVRSAATTLHAGNYTVTATVGSCQSSPATVTVTVNSISSVTASNLGPYCAGETIQLNANTIAGASYSWSGPNGFTSTDEDPTISNSTSAAAGTYTVTVTLGACTGQNTTTVTMNSGPVKPTITLQSFPDRLESSSFTNNQWYKDGAMMFGETGPSLVFPTPGVYTVSVTGGNGCETFSDPYYYGVSSTKNSSGIGSITAYPNPSEGMFRIEAAHVPTGELKLTVQNSLGLEVSQENYIVTGGSLNADLNLQHLAKGVYYLHFDVGGGMSVVKVVIE